MAGMKQDSGKIMLVMVLVLLVTYNPDSKKVGTFLKFE